MFCRIRRRKRLEQKMGSLPAFRIQSRMPPFTSVAVDFFGNLKIKQSRNVSANGLVLIITCMTTRCIHLELCLAIDTNSFLQAWRRFATIRGIHPTHAFSDVATTFKGGSFPIAKWVQDWDCHLIEKELNEFGTHIDFQWSFNVPTASHMNGVVESLVNSVRKGLDAAVVNCTRSLLTYEERVTYVINSRPLIPEGDPSKFTCITGNSLLHPYGQPQVCQSVFMESFSPRNPLKVIQKQVDIFWNTWMKHMPPQLNCRNKWFHTRDNLEPGDFVIILEPGMKENTAPRSTWRKAIVTAIHPGSDGLVRSVTVRDASHKEYVRPIHKLCLIATRQELENEQ